MTNQRRFRNAGAKTGCNDLISGSSVSSSRLPMRRFAFLLSILLYLNAQQIQAQQRTVPPPTGETPVSALTPSAPQTIVQAPAVAARPNGKIQKSLVRITATEVEPDYKAPW